MVDERLFFAFTGALICFFFLVRFGRTLTGSCSSKPSNRGSAKSAEDMYAFSNASTSIEERSRTSLSNISGSVTANRGEEDLPVAREYEGAGGANAAASGQAETARAAVAAAAKAHLPRGRKLVEENGLAVAMAACDEVAV